MVPVAPWDLSHVLALSAVPIQFHSQQSLSWHLWDISRLNQHIQGSKLCLKMHIPALRNKQGLCFKLIFHYINYSILIFCYIKYSCIYCIYVYISVYVLRACILLPRH